MPFDWASILVCGQGHYGDLSGAQRAMSEHVEFRDLKYIAAVAEAGNFTRAAEGLFVSQPSLSKQIKDVEIETGVQIFERRSQSLHP